MSFHGLFWVRVLVMATPIRQSAFRAIVVSLPGIALIPLVITPPEGIPPALLMVNPALMVLILGFLGAATAERSGLIAEWILGAPIVWKRLWLGLVIGLLAGITAAAADQLLAPHWQTPETAIPTLLESTGALPLAVGILYGGLTEEVMMRFGLLSAALWALLKFLPRNAAIWLAALFAGLLFALGHLPAVLASGTDLTAPLVARILGFNTALGLLYGLLYARKSLFAAAAAHAGTHLGVFCLSLLW
jgi:membrane protease YdiL (CAAX protease family)